MTGLPPHRALDVGEQCFQGTLSFDFRPIGKSDDMKQLCFVYELFGSSRMRILWPPLPSKPGDEPLCGLRHGVSQSSGSGGTARHENVEPRRVLRQGGQRIYKEIQKYEGATSILIFTFLGLWIISRGIRRQQLRV